MLGKIKIFFSNQENLNTQMGSLFHGFLMDNLSREEADELHKNGLKPYSQSIIYDKGQVYWEISTLNKAMFESIKNLVENIDSIYIKNKSENYKIIKKLIESQSKEDFIKSKLFLEKSSRYTKIYFLTPTTFKSKGKYVNMPNIYLIFQNLLNKLDSTSEDYKYKSQELLDEINENVYISNYNLKSVNYNLEGVKIPAFKGNITISIRGSMQFRNLINMLISFAEYSGVGIKTTLGMGKIRKGEIYDR